jgi:hypothetical protein
MLVIWTTADAQLLRRTIWGSLEAMQPNTPKAQAVEWQDGPPVVANLGDVVLACGSKPLDSLKKAGIAPKNRGLISLRETPLCYKTEAGLAAGHYLVTYDPAITHSEPDKQQVIDWDLRLAIRLLTTGSMAPEVGHYRWVGGFSELISAINCAHAKSGQRADVTMDRDHGPAPVGPGQAHRLDRLHLHGRQGGPYEARSCRSSPTCSSRCSGS